MVRKEDRWKARACPAPTRCLFYCTTRVTVAERVTPFAIPLTTIVYVPLGVGVLPALVVVIFTCEVFDVLPGITDVGVRVQVAPPGTPVQVSDTVEL
jgi:hypothetical protein